MASNYISFPRVEGRASRQAHADLPERHLRARAGQGGLLRPRDPYVPPHPPTGWVDWEGPLRPRAFDLNKIERQRSLARGTRRPVLSNANVKLRFWRVRGAMDHLARNGDGDELLFVHEGAGDLYCDYGHLAFRPATIWCCRAAPCGASSAPRR